MLVAGLVGSVAVYTAIGFWWDKLGAWGMASLGLVVLLMVAVFNLMPERALQRLSGAYADEELGQLHEEGVALRQALPWLPDTSAGDKPLNEFEAKLDDWTQRVHDHLEPRWRGTFLSDVTGFRTATSGYGRASRYRNYLDDRLERLSQIVAAMGRKP